MGNVLKSSANSTPSSKASQEVDVIKPNLPDQTFISQTKYPYNARATPFVRSSIDNNNILSQNHCPFMILPGGGNKSQTQFMQLICNCNKVNSTSKKSNINYNDVEFKPYKPNCNTSRIGRDKGYRLFCFYLAKHKTFGDCFLVINGEYQFERYKDKETNQVNFNIYKCNQDEWVFDYTKNEYEPKVEDTASDHSYDDKNAIGTYSLTGLLFDQNLLIISNYYHLNFYDFTILDKPRYIGSHKLDWRFPQTSYSYHGIICCEKRNDFIQLLLFGGDSESAACPFKESFSDIRIKTVGNNIKNIDNINKDNFSEKILIEEKKIVLNIKDEQYSNSLLRSPIGAFGYNCFLNEKNELIVIMIGGGWRGKHKNETIMLFNCQSHNLWVLPNVCTSIFYIFYILYFIFYILCIL